MNVRSKIAELNLNKLHGVKVYLFGSAVYNDTFDDIDLAVIYNKAKVAVGEMIAYRKYLKKEIAAKLHYDSDILLLSQEEELETEFLLNAKHSQIL